MTSTDIFNMFDVAESMTSRIFGENGTAMLATTGDALLDVFSSTTRIDPIKVSSGELTACVNKFDACIDSINSNGVATALFCALGFYQRDIKEKGERTLFHIFFCRLWKHDKELTKKLMTFIVGSSTASDDAESDTEAESKAVSKVKSETEYFGSWKDLHQIIELASTHGELGLSRDDIQELFHTILQFEGDQLEADWKSFVDGTKGGPRPQVSLCAKWLVSAGKHFDKLYFLHGDTALGYHAGFCAVNATALVRMCEYARASGVATFASWKKIKESDFIGLQKVLRKVKSALNDFMGTPEQDMCAGTWSEIDPSRVPARNMAKHKRAFHNEKSVKERKSTLFDTYNHPFGDRSSVNDRETRDALEQLQGKIGTSEFVLALAELKASLSGHPESKIIDRILCRFRIMHCVASGSKKIHGARADIADMVKTALRVHNAHEPLLASKISEWTGSNPERALLHRQAEDKFSEISAAINKAMAESIAEVSVGMGADEKVELYNNVRINLKRTIGLYDVSGSMESGSGSVKPINVCLGLSYFITRLSAPVGITFHERPTMFKVDQDWDFAHHIHKVKGQEWGGSTNFEAAFRLILDYGCRNKLSQDQMPESMFVISDMQFDHANARANRYDTMFETMEREFAKYNYKLPLIVFWNVNGQYKGQSVGATQRGVITISGFDPAIMKTIAECGTLGTIDVKTGKTIATSPIETMVASLTRPRYMPIIMTALEHVAEATATASSSASTWASTEVSDVADRIRGMYAPASSIS